MKLFQRLNADEFADLSRAEAKSKMEELATEFELFKRSRGDLVTARNRLLFAYNNVCAFCLLFPSSMTWQITVWDSGFDRPVLHGA